MIRKKQQEKKAKEEKGSRDSAGAVRFEYGCWTGDGWAHLGAGRG